MRFHAARVAEEPLSRSSSPIADRVALVGSAGLLLALFYLRGPGLARSGLHFDVTLAITLVFAVCGRLVRGVSNSGASAGAVVAFIMADRGIRLFAMLLILFVLTFLATRAGASRKRRMALAESSRGRSASQVMANLGIAALALLIFKSGEGELLALAALAEAAADTTSSEVGAAFSANVVLITTWKAVPSGTDGGISLRGTAAGIAAASLIAASAAVLLRIAAPAALLIGGAGVVGMLMDSLLGATLERRGFLNNDLVNLAGTFAAAAFAWMLHPK